MGSLHEAATPQTGHIYLQKNVVGEFDRMLASTQHATPDTFLEHLLELCLQREEETKVVKVRTDIAQKFTALQCRFEYQSSNDLMKHLLQLYVYGFFMILVFIVTSAGYLFIFANALLWPRKICYMFLLKQLTFFLSYSTFLCPWIE